MPRDRYRTGRLMLYPSRGDVRSAVPVAGHAHGRAVAIGCVAITKDIGLAGEKIVERAGIGSAAVIWSSGKTDVERAITGACGVLKGCVVGVTFLAIRYAGIRQRVLGVAAGSTGSCAAGRRSVTLVTIGGHCKVGRAPSWSCCFKVAVDIGAGPQGIWRDGCLVEKCPPAVSSQSMAD